MSKQTLLEPTWRGLESFRTLSVPVGLADWLTDAGSLTSRLISSCSPHTFKVRLLRQRWLKPLYSEQQKLGMRHAEVALVREVQLLCDQQRWVFARTLIPASSFTGKARRLAYLGNKPLGALLFADPSTERENMQFARLLPGHKLHANACENLSIQPSELWGRRTLFYYAHRPLLVNEIFLPDIPANME